MMLKGANERIVGNNIRLDMQKAIKAQFLTSAIVGVIEWWFIGSMPCSVEDITDQLWTLLEHNLMVPGSH